ncbi:hypothetical protein GE21DRAFT_4433 [Neurospora crassa]|uniref:BHLH domain-containing protein n=1 Tax=Neurospora crassa (strain ATCC 24698 / 74-OR23-1A / CBS 708.71 / DSM 1257 / FGSC 987) TaxID=367110 RepID=U9W4W0_NEUCR|nr:hypothetical protein NCU00144 [Neurospora crassa OR74A]XP_011393767.1 uncharacterized protein NCU00144 [Neurospora crassa OR74A]ESA43283.1 hypothetical protein NCU00144 [Neurospora crassa OR74A]ESA43284.1 hypothetical protein, variant [Neurospora crassa OR74A]KHE89452.1 hypothetical protein GE21DRAFT_4433 [Neurospora crassa]|eukprot:XP_011393766.1 hypothetical protein NCU00144 [Neurospora crassa OR74A]
MARTYGDQPGFDNYGAGTYEEMMTEVPSAFSLGSGPKGLGIPEHATYSENQTTSIHTTHQRSGPSLPYPNFASSARQTTLATSPSFPVTTASYHVPTPENPTQPPYYQQGAGWEQQQLPSTSAAALYNREHTAVPAPPALTPYEFAPSHDISGSCLGDGSTYGSPPVVQSPIQPGFGFLWANGHPPNSVGSNTPSQRAIASPTARTFESISAPSDTGFSDHSDGVAYANIDERANHQQQQQQQQQSQQHRWVQTTTVSMEGCNKSEDGPWNTGEKKAFGQIMTPISCASPFNAAAAVPPAVPGGAAKAAKGTASATAALSKNKGKLRSASRAPKNIQPRPEETPEERKSRNSHNLVEKQYRNRLNAQFERLLAVLPDSVRSSMTMIGGCGGDPDGVNGNGGGGSVIPGQHPSLDFSIERRLSKAEVLDMSRRYILSLEKERDTLEREKEQLMHSIDQLRQGHGHPSHGGHAGAMYLVDRNGIPIGHGHMRGVGG